MDAISAFFMQNIVYVYFFYGLAFFAMGLVVLLESGRASEFRFSRALLPLALFGFIHGGHEWFEMFQIFAAHETGYVAGPPEEAFRIISLVASFLCLLAFGTRLLPGAEQNPHAAAYQVAAMALLWLAAVAVVYGRFSPVLTELLVAADVLARYGLAIPGSVLAAWALLRERHDFHARGMSRYGQALLWAALAFLVYGAIGQAFTRPSLVFPSQTINTALFLRTFGIPVQLLRGLAAGAITLTLGSALRAFEAESRIRLARANKARIEAQAAALEAQQRRADEVEALNVELRARAGELTAMVEMSQILNSTLILDRLLRYALYQIIQSIEGARCGVAYLKENGGGLRLAGEYRRPEANEPPVLLHSLAARAIEHGGAVTVGADGGVHPLERIPVDAPAETLYRPRYAALGLPLVVGETFLGGLAVCSGRSEPVFSQADANLLGAFAQQTATAVENALLYRVVEDREARLEQLVRQLVNAQEGERGRIARELHDETGQQLTALAMGLAAVEQHLAAGDGSRAAGTVRNLRELADGAIRELRNIMADLRPAQLDDLGLVPALRWYIGQFSARQPELRVELNADRALGRLPAGHETVLFRAVQEALANVARHARAGRVEVALRPTPGGVRLEVSDDGIGFDPAAPPRHEPGSGLGLVGLRERVALVGGRVDIASAPGQGTRIVVELPVK